MRKIFKNMAWTMAATLVMAACSDSLDESSGNGNDLNTDGTGYVKIALNLPSTSGASTRADSENDDFNDGLAAEYNVNDVILALFYGTDENTATYKWATELSNLNFVNQGTSTDNITTKSNYVVSEVPKPGTSQKVFALAIVNNSDYFSVSNYKLYYDAAGTNPTEFPTTGTFTTLFTKASDTNLTKIASTTANKNKGNFMMTNAPIAKQPSVSSGTSWNPDITTLVELKVYDDKPTAEAAPSNPIYVERVVAKVNVKVNANSNTLTISDETFKGATVEFTGWELQNTNKLTYLVRNVGSGEQAAWKDWIKFFSTDQTVLSKENRFVGTQPDPYRTYWGIDPNYDAIIASDKIGDNFNVWSANSAPQKWLTLANNSTAAGSEVVAYCAENTTTAKVMQTNQLTGILLEATFKLSDTDGVDFFTCNGVNQIYTKENMLKALTAELAASSEEGAKLGENEILEIKAEAEGAVITDANGLNKVFQITGGTPDPKDLSDTQVSVILKKYLPINFYKGGRTYYYATLIKHFGEEYTPASGVSSLENYSDQNHLGRYGVLRNNWYELQINSVSGPGEPEIPVIPEEPADKEHRYINCEINILSWAKRSQGVDL
ncbi:Mfa1 family fimbria major subunit [Bacteroides ndongoniae]|uniref:Mfa1 family fimbria major subunit n=1 Tax=Bacteroides ndongoniae TaxID=1903262 RepID=UPI0023F9D0B3|nr:Mfa1 family fimbria major subunit [Bacteroides ndongoniae]